MKFPKLKILIIIAVLFFAVDSAHATTTYYLYYPQMTGASVSGSLAAYFSGDVFVPATGGSDCTYTALYAFQLGYYPSHNQPSLDYVSGLNSFYENFSGRCGQHVAMHTELAGKPAGNYVITDPAGCPQYNNWTPSYCIFYWDGTTANMNNCSITPTTPTLTISGPASGTTITSNSTTLSGNYYALSLGIYGYGYLHITLQNAANGLYSTQYSITLSGRTGSFSIPLSTFGITENGTWNLKAEQELDANTYVDLTSTPPYNLVFNVSGNSTPYVFSNFNTWYSSNAAGGYTAPSDWATSLTSFIQTIFVNAGEFVNNTLKYFNSTDFYDKGNQLGLVFPTTQAYLNKINIFFGGFPLIQFFEMLTFVMLGIFIVRTIFKFIPFFG